MNRITRTVITVWLICITATSAQAANGDPQLKTNHLWYPGELACSSFDRLFQTQAKLYEHVTGRTPTTDHDKVLASWLWRNTHYFHGEPGGENLWAKGFTNGGDTSPREYWMGLFAHGFGLCGTTHAQWTAEMHYLLGHNRGRVVGTTGHNSFEVYLTGSPYGPGRWALLDHDLSTVIFDRGGERLVSINELKDHVAEWTRRDYRPEKQQGWLVCGLHPGDGAVYDSFHSAEYFAGYCGPPPIVHLRRGESLRRYLEPGLEDGRTFVFWGRNSNTGNIPGPERSRTWVNQPEKMFGSTSGTDHRDGQARYGNAVYHYTPDFRSADYREAVISEGEDYVTFEFNSPYIIAATPPSSEPWAIYESGCRNGLVLRGNRSCDVSISVNRGQSWLDAGQLNGSLDLTDAAKGYRQYWLRFGAAARDLADDEISITTVCQANPSTMTRVADGETIVDFATSQRAVVSAGPTIEQAQAHIVEGTFASPRVSLELAAPRGERVVAVHAAAHVLSSNPPDPDVQYTIEMSTDGGQTWSPMVADWRITRVGEQPADFWSQSFCWAEAALQASTTNPVRVRFRNTGGKHYARAEMHLVYEVPVRDATKVTFCWSDNRGRHETQHTFSPATGESWRFPTGAQSVTHWVEMTPALASN